MKLRNPEKGVESSVIPNFLAILDVPRIPKRELKDENIPTLIKALEEESRKGS